MWKIYYTYIGIFNGDYSAFEAKVKTLWFKMYERSSGKMSSSGFEHVFIGKKNKMIGWKVLQIVCQYQDKEVYDNL